MLRCACISTLPGLVVDEVLGHMHTSEESYWHSRFISQFGIFIWKINVREGKQERTVFILSPCLEWPKFIPRVLFYSKLGSLEYYIMITDGWNVHYKFLIWGEGWIKKWTKLVPQTSTTVAKGDHRLSWEACHVPVLLKEGVWSIRLITLLSSLTLIVG